MRDAELEGDIAVSSAELANAAGDLTSRAWFDEAPEQAIAAAAWNVLIHQAGDEPLPRQSSVVKAHQV